MAEFTKIPAPDREPQNLIENLMQAETILLLLFAAFAVLAFFKQIFGSAAADGPAGEADPADHTVYEDEDGGDDDD